MSRPKIVIKSKDNNPPKEQNTAIPQRAKEKTKNAEQPAEPASSPSAAEIETPRRKGNLKGIAIGVTAALLVSVAALAYYFLFHKQSDSGTADTEEATIEEVIFNYENQYSEFEKDILSEGRSVGTLLNEIGIAGADISEVSRELKSLNLSRLRKGDKFTVYYEDEQPEVIELQPKSTPYHKYIIKTDDLSVEKIAKKREVRVNEMAAIVEGNLGVTFINNNLNLKLISKLEEIFQYSLDLFEIDDGDRFKILYETEYLDGKANEVLGIVSAFIQEGNKKYYAFRNENGNSVAYYNEYGESMKKSFLLSPIKYGGVISSGFGLRVHPKLGHTKMHLGTDYAAPEGTPIVAVADGIVTGRAFAGNNGNFIKIKHDNTFETQYLHMQKFNPSVIQGSRVKQGEVIGYVGMTGLATGPHVCYRFKKDGEQVNPADHNSGKASRVSPGELQNYMESIAPMQSAIKKVEYF